MKYKFLAFATLFLASLSVYADLKVGFVEVQKILQEAPQTIEINKKLEKEFNIRTDKLKTDIKALTSAFNLSVRELNSFSNFLLLSIVCGASCKILSTWTNPTLRSAYTLKLARNRATKAKNLYFNYFLLRFFKLTI